MAKFTYSAQKAAIEKQIAKLKKQAELLVSKSKMPKIQAIVKTMREFGITPDEIAQAYGKTGRKSTASRGTTLRNTPKTQVPPKYRHPDSGATWTGRGRAPRWVVDAESSGQSRDQFLIANG